MSAATTATRVPLDVNVSIEQAAGPVSRALLWYLNPLFNIGAERPLEQDDLGGIADQDKCNVLYVKFIVLWNEELKKPKRERSLWKCLWRTVGYSRLFVATLLYGIYAASAFGPILILTKLVNYFIGIDSMSITEAWILTALLFVIPEIGSICAAQNNVVMSHIGVQIRNILINIIFRKSLRLSSASRSSTSTGQIVNMFSTDTKQLQSLMYFASMIIFAPIQIAVALALIYQQVTESTFVGLGFMIAIVPLNVAIFITMAGIRKQMLVINDQRVKMMNEILTGIRILKYYAWEGAFYKKVMKIRDDELILLRKLAYVVAIGFSMVLLSVPIVQPILIFFTYVKLGNQLNAAKAFTTISLFNLIRFPFAFLPMGLAQYAQAKVSVQRIIDFLCSDELPQYINKSFPDGHEDVVISFDNVSMSWSIEEIPVVGLEEKKEDVPFESVVVHDQSNDVSGIEFVEIPLCDDAVQGVASINVSDENLINRSMHTLIDISMRVKKGQLVAVVGSVGSGKSSLLNAIIGELVHKQGTVHVNGSLAYCDQKPWILNTTLKENITFGRPYNEERFDVAIHAASLEDDIKVLPGGVMTEIGERGINLSGGQKARVALARAVYRDADIYLLDDPMSAMDAHVGAHIFEQCIQGVLKTKTRILVTHHLYLLSKCDLIVIIDQGKFKHCGTYQELANTGLDLEAYLPSKAYLTDDVKLEAAKVDTKKQDDADARKKDDRTSLISTTEERKEGQVKLSSYWYYINSGSPFLFLFVCLAMSAGKGIEVWSTFFLSDWSQAAVTADKEGHPLSGEKNIEYLNRYALLACCGVIGVTIRSLLLANHRLRASRALHDKLLTSVIACPISFFDATPLGRVLNRFSSDMQSIDEDLSANVSQLFNAGFNCIASVAGICGATSGTFLVILAPLSYLYYRAQSFFRRSSTEIQRLESISKSPIFANFSQTLAGVGTIRAYGDEERFVKQLEENADANSVAQILLQLAFQWLSLRLDFIGSLTSFFVAALALASSGFVPAGSVALGLSFSFDMCGYLKYAVRMIAQVEANMNSVERLQYYSFELTPELSTIPQSSVEKSSTDHIPKDWPSTGEIVARDVKMNYQDGPDVLKGLSFDISSKQKVGIAGRTGSGKSSLMVALFRIENFRGTIQIDGIDTKTVPLNLLRSKLGIIPQDPVMFSETVRFNLDPTLQHTDDEIWAVLEKVEMKNHILSLPCKLDDLVSEGGDNFSAGQRQLICIARALLRNPSILVLDEATASIDNETDSIVQAMIRSSFKESTVLTIAHRLHTIIDADKIAVIDSGVVAEMDSPANLLKNPEGLFTKLWAKNQSSHGGAGAMKKSASGTLLKDL